MTEVLLEHKKRIGLLLDYKIDSYGIYFFVAVNQHQENMSFSIGFEILDGIQRHEGIDIKSFNIKEVSLVCNPAQENTNAKKFFRK